jgi:hypothetical protein
MSTAATGATRAAWIAGMREFLDFAEKHDEIPLFAYGHDVVFGFPDRAGVDAVAEVLGTEAEQAAYSYRAVRKFGPIVTYVVRTDALEAAPQPVNAGGRA